MHLSPDSKPFHLLLFILVLLKQVGAMEEVGVAPNANLHKDKEHGFPF